MKGKNIAVIPARKGSKGFKFKNRILLNETLNFLKEITWFDEKIISTDDEVLIRKAKKADLKILKRSKKNSKNNVSIKKVMEEIVNQINPRPNDKIWLLYLTIPYKNKKDFINVRKISQKKNFQSLLSFREVITHPFDCWIIKPRLKQLIKNKAFRRQDKPIVYEHYHYLSCFKVSHLKNLNEELINKNTVPYLITGYSKYKINEIDSKFDLKYYKLLNKNNFSIK